VERAAQPFEKRTAFAAAVEPTGHEKRAGNSPFSFSDGPRPDRTGLPADARLSSRKAVNMAPRAIGKRISLSRRAFPSPGPLPTRINPRRSGSDGTRLKKLTSPAVRKRLKRDRR